MFCQCPCIFSENLSSIYQELSELFTVESNHQILFKVHQTAVECTLLATRLPKDLCSVSSSVERNNFLHDWSFFIKFYTNVHFAKMRITWKFQVYQTCTFSFMHFSIAQLKRVGDKTLGNVVWLSYCCESIRISFQKLVRWQWKFKRVFLWSLCIFPENLGSVLPKLAKLLIF